jgi:hypothetical protein
VRPRWHRPSRGRARRGQAGLGRGRAPPPVSFSTSGQVSASNVAGPPIARTGTAATWRGGSGLNWPPSSPPNSAPSTVTDGHGRSSLTSILLIAGERPVRFGGRYSPTTAQGMVDQCLGCTSNARPVVIGAMKESPGPERRRGSDRAAGQVRRHRCCVALRRLEHRSPQPCHVIEEGRTSNAAVFDVADRRLSCLGESGRIDIPRRPRRFVDIDEHCDFGCRHTLEPSRRMGAW